MNFALATPLPPFGTSPRPRTDAASSPHIGWCPLEEGNSLLAPAKADEHPLIGGVSLL